MAAGIRAGQCFVEIRANDTHFQRGMVLLSNRMQAIGQGMRNFGARVGMGAAAVGIPILGAARAAATFEDTMLGLKASTSDISPAQMKAVREEALRLSAAMGVAPERIGQAFNELIKAGMSVEDALGGAAKSAVEFSHVSQVDAQAAAVFMKNSMDVWGISAKEAADTLSAAADSSATSIAEMVQAFGLIGSAGAAFNQSLFGISQSMGYLSNWFIRGEEAGTGLKTFLVKLIDPATDANEALRRYGLTVASFRNEAGKLLSLGQIADVLRNAMGKFGDEIEDDALLVKIFGDRGVRVMAAFAKGGKEGFDKVGRAMEQSRSVSEKFSLVMGGLTGFFEKMLTAVKLLSIGFSEKLSPSLNAFGDAVIYVAAAVAKFFDMFPVLSGLIVILTALAAAMAVVSFVVGGLVTGVSAFIAGLVSLHRAFTPTGAVMMFLMRWGPRVATAFGWIAAAVGSLTLGLQALLAVAAGAGLGVLLAWLTGAGTGTPAKGKARFGKALVTPDKFEKPMEGQAGGGGLSLGANRGTFFASLADQIGIGPQTGAAERTANATERTAVGVERLAANFPKAGDLQAGMAGVAGKVGIGIAPTDRDMVNAVEKTAVATEKTASLLERLARAGGFGANGMAFA
jgi:TP901 family phage tail tape measure protein